MTTARFTSPRTAQEPQSAETKSIESRTFRDAIGGFATGVSVITFCTTEVTRGVTANAVTSISLDPMLVGVCIGKNTSAHRQLEAATSFAVNILASDQVGVSNAFAGKGIEGMQDVPYSIARTGAPILEGVIAWLDCEVYARVDGGDHTLYLGRVHDLGMPRPNADPLLFFRGRYESLQKMDMSLTVGG